MARSRDPAEDRTRGSPTDGLGQRAPFRRVDRVVIPVPNLREGLAFYRDGLGHEVVWLADDSAGLRLPDSETELVLQTRRASSSPTSPWTRSTGPSTRSPGPAGA
jgi:catechol 2,3-dioxygenase-like lactoylglutathione lyase family enzyme